MSALGPTSDIYIGVPLDTDPQDLLDDCYAYLAAAIPGWVPSQGQLDVWLLMAISSLAAETRDVASVVPASIFRWFGANLVGIPPFDETEATCLTTWNLVDDNGHTIPAGTQVAIAVPGSSPIPFVTTTPAIVAPGSSSISGINVEAIDAGAFPNGIGVVDGPVILLDGLSFVSSVTQDTLPAGGQDAEADSIYLNRLAAELQLLAPRPILPRDFAIYSRNIIGVYRATALDGYNADLDETDQPRTVSVAAVDISGIPISSDTKTALLAYLQAAREQNFLVFVVDPVVSLINVTVSAKMVPGADPTIVQDNITAALEGFLNPLSWGGFADGGINPRDWNNTDTLRYNALLAVCGDAKGVAYIESLTFAIDGDSEDSVDITLPGVFPLVKANTLAVTASA